MLFEKGRKAKAFIFWAGLAITMVADTAYGQMPGSEPKVLILEQFDKDSSGWLDITEREAAREWLAKRGTDRGQRGGQGFGGPANGNRQERDGGRGGRANGGERRFGRGGAGPGGPGGRGGQGRGAARDEAKPGPTIEKSSAQTFDGGLYDTNTFRTIFIDFENEDWEAELESFHNTDVEVPATLTVDGQEYEQCGLRFRGASSYGHVPTGYKRSFNVSVDLVDEDQRLLGYKTLNLLNANGDNSLLSTVLYSHVAREYMPAPKANLVKVVINGEYWGVYTNVQQFNKQFLKENYGSGRGARWKVHGSPRGGGGLDYRGEDPKDYGHPYELKSGKEKALEKLIEFCRVLDETPAAELPEALEPICDVDELLWFLALDVGLMNSDGYWVRASDYSIYLDGDDKFHFIPHDMNEGFRPAHGGGPMGGGPGGPMGRPGPGGLEGPRGFGGPGGPGGFGAPQGQAPRGFGRDRADDANTRGRPQPFGSPQGGRQNGPEGFGQRRPAAEPQSGTAMVGLDPLIGLDDPSKPLRSKVLAVPKYREQYLQNLKTLARETLNWGHLGPFISSQVKQMDPAIKMETRGLASYGQFVMATSSADELQQGQLSFGPPQISLKSFLEGRSEYLLNYEPEGQRR